MSPRTWSSRLVEVARAAKDAGLAIVPTLIVLNMSGRIWWPAWMLDADGTSGAISSPIPTLLRSQALLVEACARALAGDACVRAFDLAQRDRRRAAPAVARCRLALGVACSRTPFRRAAPGVPVQIGAHLPSLTTENNMRVDDLAAVADEDVMHAYPLYCDVARSFLDPELVPFSCALTAGARRDAAARPLMQEFGLCTAPPGVAGHTITDDFLGQPRPQYLASEEEGGDVLRRGAGAAGGDRRRRRLRVVLRRLRRAPVRSAAARPAVRERTFGLVRADGSEKPAADVFRALQAAARCRCTRQADRRHRVLDVSADEYYRRARRHFARLYANWLARE